MSDNPIFANLTRRIIEQMRECDANGWSKPWVTVGKSMCMPRNAATGNEYRGGNVLGLWASAQDHGFTDPTWATYRQ